MSVSGEGFRIPLCPFVSSVVKVLRQRRLTPLSISFQIDAVRPASGNQLNPTLSVNPGTLCRNGSEDACAGFGDRAPSTAWLLRDGTATRVTGWLCKSGLPFTASVVAVCPTFWRRCLLPISGEAGAVWRTLFAPQVYFP